MELSLLIPTFNEAEIIEATLRQIASALGESLCREVEVLIADDGSDELPQKVREIETQMPFAQISVVRNTPAVGKGEALARCFAQVQAPIAGFLDADLSVSPDYIPAAISCLRSGGADIVIASRRVEGAEVRSPRNTLRRILSDILPFVAAKLLFRSGRSYADTQCGFKFFKSGVAHELYSGLSAKDGMADLEILVRANLLNYRVRELPVVWTDYRPSKRPLSRTLARDCAGILRLAARYNFGKFRNLNSQTAIDNSPRCCTSNRSES